MKKIFTLLFCFALLGTYAQTTVLLTPVQYNTIYEAPNTSNGAGLYFFAGNTITLQTRRGLLPFDLSGIRPGIYLIELVSDDGKRAILKMVKK